MIRQISTIARFSALEAVRSRLFALVVVAAVAALLLAEFTSNIAVTESGVIRTAILGSLLRALAVFIMSLVVASHMARELADKGAEAILALPLPRAAYYLGKLAGFALLALAITAVFCAAALLYAPWAPSLLWAVSLFCELLIVAAATLLCMLSFNQVTATLFAVAGFYLLSRAIPAIQLMGHEPTLDQAAWSTRFMARMIDAIAFVLPDLHRFTKSEWLAYGDITGSQLAGIVAQTAIYLLLLAGAGLFDLYRRNF